MARLISATRCDDIVKILKDNGVVPEVPVSELKMHLIMDSIPEIEIKYTPEVFDKSKPDKLTKP